MINSDGMTLHTPRKRGTAKYGYSLFLLLGAYLFYHEGISHAELALLGLLIFFALVCGVIDYFSHSPLFQQCLNRLF